jgi:hypothetical protein
MEDKLQQAQQYRTRADRLRAIARELAEQSQRDLLIQLADEYDEMAHSAAAVARAEVSRALDGRAARLDRKRMK